MRTTFACRASASLLLAASVALVGACASNDAATDGPVGETQEALARQLVDRDGTLGSRPPPPPPKPDAGVDAGGKWIKVVDVASGAVLATSCEKKRFDLRRKTRACEDLPGAYVENGVTFVPGAGGRFRVGRLLAGTTAPAALQAKACSFTWEPASCGAPDTAKLLVTTNEKLSPRPDACLSRPGACGVVATLPSTRFPSVIPNGPGRCEVCGFATQRSMWVVLPPEWNGFSYQLAGEMTQRFVFLEPSATPSDEPSVVEVDLGYDVADQDVSILPAIE